MLIYLCVLVGTGGDFAWSPRGGAAFVDVERRSVTGPVGIEPFPSGSVGRAGAVSPQRTIAGTPRRYGSVPSPKEHGQRRVP